MSMNNLEHTIFRGGIEHVRKLLHRAGGGPFGWRMSELRGPEPASRPYPEIGVDLPATVVASILVIKMSIEDALLEKLRSLPVNKQQEVLDFAEFLRLRTPSPLPLHSSRGLCEDLGVDITEEDIAEARREMWGNFPRDIDV